MRKLADFGRKDRMVAINLVNLKSFILLGCFLLCVGASAPSTQPSGTTPTNSFSFGGKPIHPSCLLLLETELSDLLPTTVAVDVEGCTQSNRYGVAVLRRNEWLRIEDKDLFGSGFFEYRWLAKLNSGIHVVETQECDGGSMVCDDLLFVRFDTDQEFEGGHWRARTLLRRCGSFVLGDRNGRTVTIQDDRVIIGPSDHQSSITISIPSDGSK
jgi:hypothetical protein